MPPLCHKEEALPDDLRWICKRSASVLDGPALGKQIDALIEEVPRIGARPHGFSRVLWVDDKPANNEHERAELRANGIVFDNVVSTMEAIAQLQTSTYDLVITDLGRMWSSDGSLEAGHRLLAEPVIADGGPPVIVYGHPQYAPQEREKLYQLGVYGVTWLPHQLFALVLRALGRAPVS